MLQDEQLISTSLLLCVRLFPKHFSFSTSTTFDIEILHRASLCPFQLQENQGSQDMGKVYSCVADQDEFLNTQGQLRTMIYSQALISTLHP